MSGCKHNLHKICNACGDKKVFTVFKYSEKCSSPGDCKCCGYFWGPGQEKDDGSWINAKIVKAEGSKVRPAVKFKCHWCGAGSWTIKKYGPKDSKYDLWEIPKEFTTKKDKDNTWKFCCEKCVMKTDEKFIIENKVISAPGAPVKEAVSVLSENANKALRIKAQLPAPKSYTTSNGDYDFDEDEEDLGLEFDDDEKESGVFTNWCLNVIAVCFVIGLLMIVIFLLFDLYFEHKHQRELQIINCISGT
jgi:hypothetical protein